MTSTKRSGPAVPPGLSEANRPIRLRLGSGEGVNDDLLLAKHVSGKTHCFVFAQTRV
ncbi:hypothetical protein ACFDR9_002137 [Janthinobacterium sp. CG_23.3]|uniref:hypothetical protein n=1 Tax=Janthinobacterium sp. CG_23.3 TaxID=3349634 RepID=UPI0038D40D7D